MGRGFRKAAVIAASLLALSAVPARAEKLTFDHRTVPALKAVLDAGDPGMIAYDGSNPRYVTDLIAVKGASAQAWTEALEIIARTPAGKVRTARDWLAELQARSDRVCASTVTTLAEEAGSVMVERHTPSCPRARAETTITRIVQGQRSLFLLSVLIKGVPDEATRAQWLALLASAHLE